MSMSNRDKRVLLIILGVLILAVVYFFPVRALEEKTNATKNENEVLKKKVTDLENMVSQKEKLEAQTQRMKKGIDKILKGYPSYVLVENEIMYIKQLEEDDEINVSSITHGEPVVIGADENVVEQVNNDVSGEENKSEGTSEPNTENTKSDAVPAINTEKRTLYGVPTTIDFTSGYHAFKKMVKGITRYSEKKSIKNLTLTFDSGTGLLTGNLIYDSYFLSGGDTIIPQKEFDIEGIERGTENIFGTVDKDKKGSKNGRSKRKNRR